jgi:hypothetical protein
MWCLNMLKWHNAPTEFHENQPVKRQAQTHKDHTHDQTCLILFYG